MLHVIVEYTQLFLDLCSISLLKKPSQLCAHTTLIICVTF